MPSTVLGRLSHLARIPVPREGRGHYWYHFVKEINPSLKGVQLLGHTVVKGKARIKPRTPDSNVTKPFLSSYPFRASTNTRKDSDPLLVAAANVTRKLDEVLFSQSQNFYIQRNPLGKFDTYSNRVPLSTHLRNSPWEVCGIWFWILVSVYLGVTWIFGNTPKSFGFKSGE